MNKRIPLFASLLGISLFAGAAMAQTQSQTMPSSSPTQNQSQQAAPSSMQTQGTDANASASSSGGNDSATLKTAQGQVVINSTVPPAPSTASPPSFEQLAGGKKYITKQDANAYPPLANDFLYASHNGARVTKKQYDRWVKDLN